MKKHMVCLLACSVLAVSGDLMAQKSHKTEISLAGGAVFADGGAAAVGGLSIGYMTKYIGAELNGAYIGYGGVFGADLIVGLLAEKRIAPYALGGVWTTTYGGLGFYAGGGFKLMSPGQKSAFRIEYRRYFTDGFEWGLNALVMGVSFFF